MSDARTTQVVIRRTPNHVNREFERRSRPESAHKGNLKRLKTSSVSGFQRWEKENELLWAMLEDETEWLAQLFPDIIITPELFFYALEDGVILCRLANLIQEKAEEYGKKTNHVNVSGKRFKYHKSIAKKNKQLALFKSRENVQGFLTWCRQLGISDSILFESNDIVEADECREGCREVVICLMEIARRASGRYKFTPIPKLIQLEKEIEAEELQDAEKNELDQINYGSSDEESTDSGSAGHSPGLDGSAVTDGGTKTRTASDGAKKKRPKKQLPKSELDQEVFKIIDNFNVYNIRKIKEGKYLILGKIMFVRMLNGHVLLRIGGGWDTLEHYLMTHLPKAAQENGDTGSEKTVSPSVSKSPQKSQLTKLIGKVKKEQQLKATPVSSPHRSPAAAKQQEELSGDDEKDITSAIRKIEFSVHRNIATRRKHSKVTVDETPPKNSSASGEGIKKPADFNQNNITADSRTSESCVNESQQEHSTCGDSICSKKMEDEKCRTESASSEEINANDEVAFGAVRENGEEKLISFEGNDENESSNVSEPLKKEAEEEVMEQGKDDVDGVTMAAALVTETDVKASAFEFEPRQDREEEATPESESIAVVNSVPVSHEEGQTVQEMAQIDFREADIEEQQQPPAPQQLSAAENLTESTDLLPGSVDDQVTDNSDDKPTPASEVPVSEVPAADVPVPVLDGSASPDIPAPDSRGSASPDAGKSSPVSPEEKVPGSPKKKAASPAKNTKEPLKTKQASVKTTAAKKETTAGRTKTTQSKTSGRPPTESTTGKNTKRPTSAAKTTTKTATSTRTTTSTRTSPTSSSASNTAAKKTFPTATSKKPATKPDAKPATRPGRPAKTTTAFGSTVQSKPPAKKLADSTRPSTAPPGRSTQAKAKPVAARVQTGLSSSRPQSARPKAAAAEDKDATDGGAASKGTGKPTKPPIRKTQTKTVTTLKKTKTGGDGKPETVTQTVKTTKSVTDANGKKTTKTTLKELSPTGRKPLRMTKTETTDSRKAPAKRNESGKTESKAGAKEPDAKSKVGGTTRVGSAGTKKTASGLGAKKAATKSDVKGEQQVSKYLKGAISKAKTVKELSNPLGITKPGAAPKTTTTTAETDVKLKEELNVETTEQEEGDSSEVLSSVVVSKEVVSNEVESEAGSQEELKIETEVQEEAKEVISNEVETEPGSQEELKIETEVQEEAEEVISKEVVSNEIVSNEVESEAGSKEEPKIETEVQEEAKEGVSNEADTSAENPDVFQDLADVEKIVDEEGKEDVEKEEEIVVNEDEGRLEKQDELVPDREEPGVEEDEGFVEKDVETGGRFEDGDKVLEEDDREVPESGEMVREGEDEQNDEQFDDETIKDAGIATEYDIPAEEPGTSYTANIEASVNHSDHSEKMYFPEINGQLDEETKTPKQDEEMFEDSIELHQDVPDQVLIEATRREVTNAWPDEQEEHGSGEETGGERQEEGEKGVERKDQDSPSSDEPQIDPWDPASHQVDFDVPHSAIVDTKGDGEYDNNNVAEYSGGALLDTESPLDPDLVPACAHPAREVLSEDTTADQIHEGVSVLEAGDKNADLFLFGDVNQNGEAQTKFQEFRSFQGDDVSPEEGSEGGTAVTVDDLLS